MLFIIVFFINNHAYINIHLKFFKNYFSRYNYTLFFIEKIYISIFIKTSNILLLYKIKVN